MTARHMTSKMRALLTCLILYSLWLSGCASVVRKDTPTIAHIHIGHAITAWPLAPHNQGLLVAAELASLAASTSADLMLEAAREGDLESARHHLDAVILKVDPTLINPDDEEAYGLRRAAAEAMTHLRLASEVEDATANVQRTVVRTDIKATQIIDRIDELTAYLAAGLQADTVGEMEIIAEEIEQSLRGIAGDTEIEGNYGLVDFRNDIETMIRNENPPYHTVDSWFLFNLVRLPDGQWGFASRRSRGAAGLGY